MALSRIRDRRAAPFQACPDRRSYRELVHPQDKADPLGLVGRAGFENHIRDDTGPIVAEADVPAMQEGRPQIHIHMALGHAGQDSDVARDDLRAHAGMNDRLDFVHKPVFEILTLKNAELLPPEGKSLRIIHQSRAIDIDKGPYRGLALHEDGIGEQWRMLTARHHRPEARQDLRRWQGQASFPGRDSLLAHAELGGEAGLLDQVDPPPRPDLSRKVCLHDPSLGKRAER